VRSISNAITIGREWDLASAELVNYALARGWCKSRDDFHFGRCYSDFLYTYFGRAKARQCRTTDLLRASKGQITVGTMMAILRDHGSDVGPDWTPARGLAGVDACAHAGFGPVRIGQSVGSMVSHLTHRGHTHWVTGTSAPCTGIFKPLWLDAGLPDTGPAPTGTYDQAALWWRHESLHREVLRDYATRLPLYCGERDALEAEFVRATAEFQAESAAERAAFSARCFARVDEMIPRWRQRVRAAQIEHRPPWHYTFAWRKFNRQANFEL
jgi:secernin